FSVLRSQMFPHPRLLLSRPTRRSSDLGLAAVALALGSMALLRALDLSLSAEARSRAGTLLLWIYAVCFFAVGFFPTDEFPTVNPPSWHGIIHAILRLISFACFSAGSLLVSLRLRREPAWQSTA